MCDITSYINKEHLKSSQTQYIDCPSSRGCCILIESSYEAVVLLVDISTLSPCPVSNPTAVLLSGPHPLEVHHHLQAAVGHSGRPLLLQLDLLHSPHAAAHVHERRAGLQYTAGELMSVMKGSGEGAGSRTPDPPRCRVCLQNGMLSALPYLGCGLFAVLSGQLADYLRESRRVPTVKVRKILSLIGKDRRQNNKK